MRKRPRFVLPLAAAVVATVALACGPVPGRAWADVPQHRGERPVVAPEARPDLGPELGRLDALAGHWAVRQSMWTDAARPQTVERGEATFTPVLGGRHLRQELRIDSSKGAFRGLGYLGFDLATRRYESLWMDVNFTGTILAHGRYDPSRRTYELVGTVPDPQHAGATLPLREVIRVQDADHFSFEYYERRNGADMLALRLEYTRRR
jgi:hypothetical protein